MRALTLPLFALVVFAAATSPVGRGRREAPGEGWIAQTSGTPSRFRGVSTVSETVAWASGANGTFSRTVDAGNHWTSGVVAGAEKLDFRDVHGVDANTAYLLSIGEGESSRIYKTTDGGKNWTLQFTNRTPKGFFDGIAFWDARNGVAFSDPVDGKLLIIRTTDGGATWTEIPSSGIPAAVNGEAAFAASGTSIVVQGTRNAWIGTGGGAARVFHTTDGGMTWTVASTPIISGGSAGIFSVAFRDAMNGVVVGGDYQKEKESSANFAITTDGGVTWKAGSPLAGFRSAVSWVRAGDRWDLIASGPSGSDYSSDGGRTWSPIDPTGYHALSFLSIRPIGFAVGDAGRIAKWQPGR
jgi:photosystem II stability/assembly factor-like uncharacterized protein